LFHNCQVFVFAQGAVFIRVGSREVFTTQSQPTHFPSGERAGAIAIQCVKLGRRRFLDLVKINLPSPLLSIAWNEAPLAARAGLLTPSSTVVATYPMAARLDSIR
jgi:hypothetical protein